MKFKKGNIPWNKGKKTGLIPKNVFKKGHKTWNKGLTKKDDDRIPQPWLGKMRSEKTKRKISETKKRFYREGKINPWNKGLTISDDDRIAQPWLGKKRSMEDKRKILKTKKRLYKEGKIKSWNKELHGEELLKHYKNGHPRGMLGKTAWNKGKELTGKYSNMGFQKGHKIPKEWRKSWSIKAKERWKDEKYAKRMFKAFNRRPNELEKTLIKLLKENNLPYKYVGDGEVWLNGKNPDFINCNGQKKVIELFGDFWHGKQITKNDFLRTKWGRKLHYRKYGFDCLVIWEHELIDNPNEVLNSIKEFDKTVMK